MTEECRSLYIFEPGSKLLAGRGVSYLWGWMQVQQILLTLPIIKLITCFEIQRMITQCVDGWLKYLNIL